MHQLLNVNRVKNGNMKYSVLILTLFVSVIMTSCLKKEKSELCLSTVLERNGMTKYAGEELECRNFLTMYEFRGKMYFELGNHCADMRTFIQDCAGNNIEDTRSDFFNVQFELYAIRLSVVGID